MQFGNRNKQIMGSDKTSTELNMWPENTVLSSHKAETWRLNLFEESTYVYLGVENGEMWR